MKIEQFRHQATTEQLNDRLSKVFGSAIKLEQFTDAQLETARASVLDKIANLEQNESFDGLSHNEDYHKQKMFLDVIDSAINDRTVEAKLQNDILVQADEIIGDYIDMDKEALKMNKQAVIADIEKRQATAQGDESSALHYAKQKVEQDFDDTGAEIEKSNEGNQFAQAVQKAKAAGMKAGDKFKVGDKEFTLQDAEELLANTMNEKSKPDFLDMDKDGDKKEPMKKAIKDKKTAVKEGAEESAQLVMASKDMVDKVTGWMEDTASMQTETMLELADAIRDEMGVEQSEAFTNSVKPSLESLYTSLEATREALTGGVAILTGEQAPDTIGADSDSEEPAMEPTTDDDADMPDQTDDFSASEPATGGEEPADRSKRESFIQMSRRLAETLSTKSKKKA
jgi:hypothetical protein|tara:strand:+ start:801 stop:1991 length:1191 start_codon:yes stop_codon:yes gene_type:complete